MPPRASGYQLGQPCSRAKPMRKCAPVVWRVLSHHQLRSFHPSSPSLCPPTPPLSSLAPCFSSAPCPTFSPGDLPCLSHPVPHRSPLHGAVPAGILTSLSRRSCRCKSALLIRHLVPARSRAEGARPGEGGRVTRPLGAAARDSPSFPRLALCLQGTCCQEPMPGLSGAANHRGARGWEWGEGPGAGLQVPRADGRWMERRRRQEGCRVVSPKRSVLYLWGLLPSLQLRGPCQWQERALGKPHSRLTFPSSNSPCQAILQPLTLPSHRAHEPQGTVPPPGGWSKGKGPGSQQEGPGDLGPEPREERTRQ